MRSSTDQNIHRACALLQLPKEDAGEYLHYPITEPAKEKLFKRFHNLPITELRRATETRDMAIKSFIFRLVYQNPHIFNEVEKVSIFPFP